ncbi:ATP-binding protein [Actinoplanes aureus]|uniref:MEDS domain-containing protein n=1 Tax=Actinoplanes aureus TaxID=2792083 RepID=A0A931FZF6_9ACTN|nr:ATP-binding protein [Actinoplanes aureus]MBG0564720.1 MEDS domain-containing protein [Actinoplanes aureus]
MTVQHSDHLRADVFVHSALIFGTTGEAAAALIPELRRSAIAYDEVLLVVGEPIRALLAERVGDLGGVLRSGDPAAFYQRLGFAYEGFRRYLAEQADAGRRVHVIAEPELADGLDDGLRDDRTTAFLAYEAICNETYAPYGSAVTCLWDSRHHPATVLDGVRSTHSHLLTPAGSRPSAQYMAPDAYLAGRRHESLAAVPRDVDHDHTLTGVAQLSALRSALTGWAAGQGFAEEPADDLVVAVVEIASNGLRHAGTPVRVRAWRRGDTLVVQCDDSAGMPVPATAGYHRPGATGAVPGGRGLWLARQLADIVLVDSAAGRTSVRLHFPYAVMHRRPA